MDGHDEGLLLDDFFGPNAFFPGLRPRAYLDLADLEAPDEAPIADPSFPRSGESTVCLAPEEDPEVEEEYQQLAWEALCRQRQGEDDEEDLDGESGAAEKGAGSDRGAGASDAQAEQPEADAARPDSLDRGLGRAGDGGVLRVGLGAVGALPRDVADAGGVAGPENPAEPRVDLGPLEDARHGLAAFRARNVYQRELKAMLAAMLDHMEEAFTTAEWQGELGRWWVVFDALRRCLEFPELAGRRARTVHRKLMRMKPEEVILVAEQGGLHRRIWVNSRKPEVDDGL